MPETLTDEMLINGVWVKIGEIINAQGCKCDLLDFDETKWEQCVLLQ